MLYARHFAIYCKISLPAAIRLPHWLHRRSMLYWIIYYYFGVITTCNFIYGCMHIFFITHIIAAYCMKYTFILHIDIIRHFIISLDIDVIDFVLLRQGELLSKYVIPLSTAWRKIFPHSDFIAIYDAWLFSTYIHIVSYRRRDWYHFRYWLIRLYTFTRLIIAILVNYFATFLGIYFHENASPQHMLSITIWA